MPALNENSFHDVWGTGGVTPDPVTRALDTKAFESQWLTEEPKKAARYSMPSPAATSAASGFIEGIPIAGPYIKSGVEMAAAKARSLRDSTSYADELATVRGANTQAAQDHPVLNATGQIAGAVAPMVPLGATALGGEMLGITGPTMLSRMVAGGASNALIGGADSAARGGDIGHGVGIGALVGGGAPVVGAALGAAGNKLLQSADPMVSQLAAKAEAMGVPLRFAQTSDSGFINKLSQMAGKLPGSGMAALHDEQQGAFNRAVAKTFGENATRITPDVMARAKDRLGKAFDDIATKSTIQFDAHLQNDLSRITQEAGTTLAGSELTILNKQIGNVLDKVTGSGTIEGPAYQALTRTGAPLKRAMQSSDPNVRHYAGQVESALHDALERSAPADLVNKLTKTRSQYKAMKTIEDLTEKSPTGDISPALLMNPVRQSYSNMAYGGGGDLANLARIGQQFMKAPPDSGTPMGTAALNLLLGAGGAGVAGYSTGYDPIAMLKGAALLPATALAARGTTTLLNRPQVYGNALNRLPFALPAITQSSERR